MFRMYRKTLVVCMEYNANIQNCDKKDGELYMETCKYGSGAGKRKPTAVKRKGVVCRAYR